MNVKVFSLCVLTLLGAGSASAQTSDSEFYGLFNRIGGDINVGSQGIGFDVAVPVTKYLELSLGLNTMPNFNFDFEVEVGHIRGTASNEVGSYDYDIDAGNIDLNASLKRTTGELKLSVYPFGDKSSWFVAGGLSFGGKDIAKLSAHSDAIAAFFKPGFTDVNGVVIPDDAKDVVQAEVDKYNFKFDRNGSTDGQIRVNKVRPYVGLGYGRLVPKKRVGFRFEAGLQFMGTMKLMQGDTEIKLDDNELIGKDYDDAVSDVVESIKVYPVLKFAITGRFL